MKIDLQNIVAFSDFFFRISVFIHSLLSLTLVLFCGMCFTADFVIVSLKDIPHIGYLAVIVLEHI
jgi:hypothetical protein